MDTERKQSSGALSVMDAVEALEAIADLEFEREVELATEEEIKEQNHVVTLRASKWTGREGVKETEELIRETFHVILSYLKEFYNKEYTLSEESPKVEGAKAIMVLVGEAAKKLEKFTTIFHETKSKGVKTLSEFKQLQEFYITRIARKIDESVLGKWILELSKRTFEKPEEKLKKEERQPLSAKYVFIDLESVKKDSEYELFFLRKEDGSRFFNPRLIRNIKLVCDFGETIGAEKTENPLTDIKLWQDYAAHLAAKDLLRHLKSDLDLYFQKSKDSSRQELIGALNQALFALLLCGNSKNLLKNVPAKSCFEYFEDFQYFLRQVVSCRGYQKLIVYGPKKSAVMTHMTLDLIQKLCHSFFAGIRSYQDLLPVFEKLFEEAHLAFSRKHEKVTTDKETLSSQLNKHYNALKQLLKQHSTGPLKKVLDLLENGSYQTFDPITQGNIPTQLYSLFLEHTKMTNLRIPSPTTQDFIQKAVVSEEFKVFLRAYAAKNKTHLLFNLQDRTSWKEHARALALEELQNSYNQSVFVVTLPKDTEFYNQESPYHLEHQTDAFFNHLKEQLLEKRCGFVFPEAIQNALSTDFTEGLIHAIHKLFFGSMNVLSQANRRDFIEIFYLFLQAKILETSHAETFSFTCKDGIDTGGVASAMFYAFFKLLQKDVVDKNDLDQINFLLYMTPLLLRERIVLPERFERMISAIKRIETTKAEVGSERFKELIQKEFEPLYATKILSNTNID